MFTKTISVVALTLAAGVVGAAETNPLHPGYAHFTATANVQTSGGSAAIAKNPLTPSFYQWNVATPANAKAPVIVENNPLQPGFKHS